MTNQVEPKSHIALTAFCADVADRPLDAFFVRKLFVRVQRINISKHFVANFARHPMFVRHSDVFVPSCLRFEVRVTAYAFVH